MSTVFAIPKNNVSTTVGSGGYTAGSYSLTLTTGGGALFPALTGSNYYRITVSMVAFAYSPTATSANYTIYKVTGISGDVLTLSSTTLEGTTDRAYNAGDVVEVRVTAGTIGDIQGAVNALEAGGSGVTIGGSVSGGTGNRLLYEGSGPVVADSANLTYNGSTFTVLSTSTSTQNVVLKEYSGQLANVFEIQNSSSTPYFGIFRDAAGGHDYFVLIGEPTQSCGIKFNYGGTKGGDFTGQLSGVDQASFGFNNGGNYGGTPGANSGRTIYFFDRVDSVYYGGISGNDKSFNWGPTSLMKIRSDGSIALASIADGSASNNSLYYSTTASKMAYKDSGGVVHTLT